MLKVIKNLPNLIPNLSKLEKEIKIQMDTNASIASKYRFNTVSHISEYSFNTGRKSMEEYKRIKESGMFPLLTIEDMIWIDENVREIENLY
jgi:hypothetical protein